MSKRDTKILEILTDAKRIEVAALAERLGVSNVTMRKDLDALQSRGLVVREHGYALLTNPNDVGGRLAYHYAEKLKIADRAASLVSDGDTIMVENGSCCALLARRVAETSSGVTIVTNSAFIASYLRDLSSVNVTLLGGALQRDSQVTVGPLVRLCAQQYVVDNLFIGADGWLDGIGFTNSDQMRAESVRSMAASATRVVVLTESEKFGTHGSVPLGLGDKPLAVVTDEGIPAIARTSLERSGVEVITAG